MRIILFLLLLQISSYALFDTGTALDKGKLEADLCVNPFESISYGQSWVFLHYGLGNKYELHGYFSKHGAIQNWSNSNYEGYIGILKQWLEWKYLDLATVVGVRKVITTSANASLIGPGVLYTFKISNLFRVAGHLQYIGDIQGTNAPPYNYGYTSEVGFYYFLTKNLELALGAFTNSQLITRPIYTINYYF